MNAPELPQSIPSRVGQNMSENPSHAGGQRLVDILGTDAIHGGVR